ncbi:MAG: Ig-like domain-containing protein [Lachnospiraceae bacterium]|nr:Ig-like domain-containing protein [Lachnospiraceae bacterium]
MTIQKGETVSLKVQITPKKAKNKKLKWTSSNKKIVSVNSKGVIKGKKKGSATIKVKTTDGSKLSVKLKVIVGTKVQRINFVDARKLTELNVGSSYTLKAEVIPADASNQTLKWSSSDPEVATVNDKGVVTAITNGAVTITAASTDGTNVKVYKSIDVVTYVKSVKLSMSADSPYHITLSSGGSFVMRGKEFRLKAKVLPETATDSNVTWSSSNSSIAYVLQDGRVLPVGCGIAVITAQASDSGHKKDTFVVQVGQIKKDRCKFIAHRGCSDQAPENSLAAIRLALQSRFDAVEFDIWQTTDREFVVSHNESLLAFCGMDVKVTQLTLAQATRYKIIAGSNIAQYPNEYIPSLNQVLKLAQQYPDKELCIELKQNLSRDMLIKLLRTVHSYDLQDRVKFISFFRANLVTLRSLKQEGGDVIALEYLSNTVDNNTIQTCKTYHASLGAMYRSLTQDQIESLHDSGLEVNVWTVPDFLTAFNLLHTMNIDRITADRAFFE